MDAGVARPHTVSLVQWSRNAVRVRRGAARVFRLDLQGYKKAHKAQRLKMILEVYECPGKRLSSH